MIKYLEDISRRVNKGIIPKSIFIHFHNAFKAVDLTKDIELFDIKKLNTSEDFKHVYYRLRKGKYRAIFYIESNDIYVVALDKREDVYRKWL